MNELNIVQSWRQKMIIGACGYAGTGSSAVSDFLKEYSSVWGFDENEFTIVHNADGLEDLKFQLFDHFTKYTSSAVAIERFRRAAYFILNCNINDKNIIKRNDILIENYINALTQVRWNGCGFIDNQLYAGLCYKNKYLHRTFAKIRTKLSRYGLVKISENKAILPVHEMNLSVHPETFDTATKEFIYGVLKNYGADFSKKILLDQPFPGNNPSRSFRFFYDDCRAIVVDRDPRDLFIYFNFVTKKHPDWLFEPVSDVKKFVAYYRLLREYTSSDTGHDNILRINLADLIYKYDETRRKIELFCDLKSEDAVQSKKYFNPDVSISNTQLFKRFPEYRNAVKYIEEHLSKYLYPYEDFGNVDTSGEIMINRTE